MREDVPNPDRRAFLKRSGELVVGAALVGAGITGAEAQEAALETQESKIPTAERIVEMTRETISKIKEKGGGRLEQGDINALRTRIFGDQDPAVAIRDSADADRAYQIFESRMDTYVESEWRAMKLTDTKHDLAHRIEEAKSKEKIDVVVPAALTEPAEDSGLRNAEIIRGLALVLARANDRAAQKQRTMQ
jgi:hypothetical protein